MDNSEFIDLAVFCGAGISKNSGLPLANELKQYILEKLSVNKEDMKEIMSSNLPFEAFIEIISENTDISKIFQIFEKGEPNINHMIIARLSNIGYIKTVFTTNFDLLIEKALEKEGLKKDRDFKVYCDEHQFSEIDFEETDDKMIKIYKIHGSIDNIDSIRTTLKMVASRILYDKRMIGIRHLFSTGNHKKVLILGYSCSDEFDITPQIKSIKENQKEIIFVDHCNEGGEIEDVRIKEQKNPFKTFPGKRIKCNTDHFIRDLWASFKDIVGEYKPVESKVEWEIAVDNWAMMLSEEPKYFIVGSILYNISNFKKAIEYSEKALEINKTTGDKAGELRCYANIGIAYDGLGDFGSVIKYNEKALEIAKAIGNKVEEAKCYAGLGAAYGVLRDAERVIKYHEKALEIAKEIGNKAEEAKFYRCYIGLGSAYDSLGDFRKAIDYYEKALQIGKAMGDKAGEAACYGNLGNTQNNLQNFKKAIELHKKALKIAKAIGNKAEEARCYINLGSAYYGLRGFKRTIEYYLQAEGISKEIKQIYFLGEVYRNLAVVYEKIGDNGSAEKYKRKLTNDIKTL